MSSSTPYTLIYRKSESGTAGTNMGKAIKSLSILLSSRQQQTNHIQTAEKMGGRQIWEKAYFMAVPPGQLSKDTETVVKMIIFNTFPSFITITMKWSKYSQVNTHFIKL